jgi:PAS domain S-box-containing protein
MTNERRDNRTAGPDRSFSQEKRDLESRTTRELVTMIGDLTRRAEELQRELDSLRGRVDVDWPRAFVRSSDDAIIHHDPEGTITGWNPAAEALYGYTHDEVVGKQKIDIIVVPSLNPIRNQYVQQLLSGEEIPPYETVRRAKDGSLIDVEAAPCLTLDADGNTLGISSVERNVSGLKQSRTDQEKVIAHDAAVKSAADTVDAMREAVLLLTLDGVVLSANPALENLVGLNAHDIIGKKLQDFLPEIIGEGDFAEAIESFEKIPDEKVVELPVSVASAPGRSEIRIAPTIALVETPAGDPSSAILTLRDVTHIWRYQNNLRALTERLIATEENERLRISKYVHDTIVQNLSLCRIRLGGIERTLLNSGYQKDADNTHNIRALMDETIDQCRSVISDLTPPLLYEVGLVAALEELADKLESHSEAPIEIIDEGLPDAIDHSLRSLLFQSARELVMNAIKHAGDCSIRIHLGGGDGTVYVRVEDDGRGFDPEAIESRLDHGRSFGLFNIRERIDGLGGQLDVWTQPGEGTAFTLTVPLTRP